MFFCGGMTAVFLGVVVVVDVVVVGEMEKKEGEEMEEEEQGGMEVRYQTSQCIPHQTP